MMEPARLEASAMDRLTAVAVCACLLAASSPLVAQARLTKYGRATLQSSGPQGKAVALYDYSQQHHDGPWILVGLAVQARKRIAIEREQIALVTPDGRRIPLASHEEYLDGRNEVNRLRQNAVVWKRPVEPYFNTDPRHTIQFFPESGIVTNSFITNLDEVAAGDLFFKAPDGTWPAGTYRLAVTHPDAQFEFPIELQ
jgi:hypothetical protein